MCKIILGTSLYVGLSLLPVFSEGSSVYAIDTLSKVGHSQGPKVSIKKRDS